MVELHAIFKGKVQGVGFRWTVQEHAERLSLGGLVANLSDGTVEVYAVGDKSILQQFLQAVQEEPGFAEIRGVVSFYSESTNVYEGFQIIH